MYNGHPQPYQDVNAQYRFYLSDGYDESYFDRSEKCHLGVWVTFSKSLADIAEKATTKEIKDIIGQHEITMIGQQVRH